MFVANALDPCGETVEIKDFEAAALRPPLVRVSTASAEQHHATRFGVARSERRSSATTSCAKEGEQSRGRNAESFRKKGVMQSSRNIRESPFPSARLYLRYGSHLRGIMGEKEDVAGITV